MERRPCAVPMAALLIASSVLVGCGGDDKPAMCSAVDALGASVDDLKSVEVSRAGLAELSDDLTAVRSDLSRVKTDAEQQYASEIEALDQAWTTLSSDLSAATSSPTVATIAQVGSDVRALGDSLAALDDAVESTC
jgi:hypothetical protein